MNYSGSRPTVAAPAPTWAPLVAILGATSWVFRADVAGSDLWWHLASGREIWERGGIPDVDPFSFTFAGQTWMNHEWLWDLVMWAAYRLDPQAVAWLNLGIVVGLFTLVYAVAWRACGSALAGGAALWLIAASAYWFIDIRPQLVTLVLVSVVLFTRDRLFALYLWPVLMVVWVNLHAGFVFGLGAIGLHALVETLRRSWGAGRFELPGRLWLGVLACVLAWLANPWGWEIIEYPLAYLEGDTPYRELVEWYPTPFALDPSYFATRFWLAGSLALVGAWWSAKRDPYPVALAAVAFAMAITSRRFIPLFLVCAAPLLAHAFAALQRALTARRSELRTAGAATGTALVGAVVAALLLVDAHPRRDLLTRWTAQQGYPFAAVRYLNAVGATNVLNEYAWGGFLMLHAPDTRVFIDGRANTLYSDPFFLRHRDLAVGREVEALSDYEIHAALLRHGPLARALRYRTQPWRVLYEDARSILLVPPGASTFRPPDPERLLADHPQWLLAKAWRAHRGGDSARALDLANRALEAEPLLFSANGLLILAHAQRGEFDAVAGVVEAALLRTPRYHERLHLTAARAYERAGAYEQALESYHRGVTSGPFLDREDTRAAIERLEQDLRANR